MNAPWTVCATRRMVACAVAIDTMVLTLALFHRANAVSVVLALTSLAFAAAATRWAHAVEGERP